MNNIFFIFTSPLSAQFFPNETMPLREYFFLFVSKQSKGPPESPTHASTTPGVAAHRCCLRVSLLKFSKYFMRAKKIKI